MIVAEASGIDGCAKPAVTLRFGTDQVPNDTNIYGRTMNMLSALKDPCFWIDGSK